MSEELRNIEDWRSSGQKIVFTNGVFDILHVGHVTYLEKAASLGDKLVIGLNSDSSVRRLDKGTERPINPEDARKKVLGALRFVDAVVIFDEDTPFQLINSVKPGVLVKGGDYDPDVVDQLDPRYIVGSAEVRANGGEVVSIPLVQGFSTTGIVNKLKGG